MPFTFDSKFPSTMGRISCGGTVAKTLRGALCVAGVAIGLGRSFKLAHGRLGNRVHQIRNSMLLFEPQRTRSIGRALPTPSGIVHSLPHRLNQGKALHAARFVLLPATARDVTLHR